MHYLRRIQYGKSGTRKLAVNDRRTEDNTVIAEPMHEDDLCSSCFSGLLDAGQRWHMSHGDEITDFPCLRIQFCPILDRMPSFLFLIGHYSLKVDAPAGPSQPHIQSD